RYQKAIGVQHWVRDVSFQESLELLISRPTVNIEGLVGGYTGPGGKTILPHKAVAKIDMRLVPDMTATEALAAIKAHLAKHGFGDGSGAHAPDEYYVIESSNPKIQGLDGAVRSQVQYLYEIARA